MQETIEIPNTEIDLEEILSKMQVLNITPLVYDRHTINTDQIYTIPKEVKAAIKTLIKPELLMEFVNTLKNNVTLNSISFQVGGVPTASIDVELTKQKEPSGIYARIFYINYNEPSKMTLGYFKIPEDFQR